MEDKKPIKIGIVGDTLSKEMESLMKLAQEKDIEVVKIGPPDEDLSLLREIAANENMVIVVDSLGGMIPHDGEALCLESERLEKQREEICKSLESMSFQLPYDSDFHYIKQPPSFECQGGKKQNIRRRKRGVNRRR